jgi:hypothetical protein
MMIYGLLSDRNPRSARTRPELNSVRSEGPERFAATAETNLLSDLLALLSPAHVIASGTPAGGSALERIVAAVRPVGRAQP